MRLYDAEGRRLYCTEEERRAFLAAAAKAPREERTFCDTLHSTGSRISEALGRWCTDMLSCWNCAEFRKSPCELNA